MGDNMLVSHSLIYILARIIPGIINFATIAVFTRLVTQHEYGLYITVLSIVGILNMFLFEWIQVSLVRFYSKYETNASKLLSTIFYMYVFIFLTITLLYLFLLVVLGADFTHLRVLTGLTIILTFLQGWYNLNLGLYRAQLKAISYSIRKLSQSTLILLICSLFAYFEFGVNGLLIGAIISFIITSCFINKSWKLIKFSNVDKFLLKEVVKYGTPLIGTLACGVLIFNTDRLFLSYFQSMDSTAEYAISSTIAQSSIALLVGAINTAGFPLITKAFERNEINSVNKYLKDNLLLMLSIAVPSAVMLSILSSYILKTLVSGTYTVETYMIPLFSIVALLESIRSNYTDLPFTLTGKTFDRIIPVFFALIINIILNFLLVPEYDVEGAITASIISYLCAILLSIYLGKKYLVIPFPRKEVIKIFCTTLIMGISIYPLSFIDNLIIPYIQIFIGILIYILLSYLFNVYIVIDLVKQIVNTVSIKVRKKNRI
jgi:O-antigen/teichoic acid export membrane protein